MMNHLRQHLTHMAVAAVAVLVLLALAGVSWADALRWALLLACPVGMVAMMWFMGRGGRQHAPAVRPQEEREGSSAQDEGAPSVTR